MSKKLMLIISSIVAITSIIIAILIIEINDNDFILKKNYSLDLSEQSKLVIKESKLFDESKGELVKFDKDLYDEYKVINIYDTDNYYFAVFSNNQDYLVNDMFLVETRGPSPAHNALYMIEKKTGRTVRILTRDWGDGDYRVDLSKINFIEEDQFVLDMYSLKDASCYNLYMMKIINTDKIFTTLDTQFEHDFFGYTYLYEKYCITNDKCIIKYQSKDSNVLGIYTINPTYNYKLSPDKNSISSKSCSIKKHSIHEKYENEKYLALGYFGYYKDTIVYLDNNFKVKELDKDIFIEQLSSTQEFLRKYS